MFPLAGIKPGSWQAGSSQAGSGGPAIANLDRPGGRLVSADLDPKLIPAAAAGRADDN